MRILIVDDDIELLYSLEKTLKREGFVVDSTSLFKEAFKIASATDYEAIIMDINLPDGNGLDLCKLLRQNEVTSPILFLSIRSSVQDKIKGLKLGADDYLTKPFIAEELILRVQNLIGRYSLQIKNVIPIGNILFDPYQKTLIINNNRINLTRTEALIFFTLFKSIGQPVSREEISAKVYGDDYPLTNSLDVLVGRLRKKVTKFSPGLIENIRAYGYILNKQETKSITDTVI